MLQIDVKSVLQAKKPALARWIPPFAINYLRRIIHEKEINSYLRDFADLPPIEFVRASLGRMGISYDAVGLENLDDKGRYIFASNHPFGGLDGLMLADKISSRFGDVRVVVNDILMNLEPLKPIFIPINKHGRQNHTYLNLYNAAFASDMPIVTFPAGLCSRRTDGVVADVEWKPNFVKKAMSSRRDIVPVFFDGELSDFFYRLANLRTGLGIHANIEMLYLPNEMFKQQGKHFNIIIGSPVTWKSMSGMTARETTLMLRDAVYKLKG
jgi:putative hemolysin